MTKNIVIGFEIGSGDAVHVSPSHLICSGLTQLSGKTTTLEALIKRSGLRAIVFKTKVGETGFTEGTVIPPYFREKSDWQYVQSLLEATMKERMKFERSWIIRACKDTDSLIGVKANIDEILAKGKLRQMDRDIFTTLQAYFELVLPQLQTASFSKTLDPVEGINIMDLERFSGEIQSLVIRSVLETVLNKHKDTVVVIPESWKFLPQARGNPCKQAAEEFIRQGATNSNFLWIDSQDMTGVDKTPLKQVSTWILGLQTEKNEVVRTLDQMPLPKSQKPDPDEIMTLRVGHFYLCSPRLTRKIYVWPAWLDEETAKKVATGEKSAEDLEKPQKIAPFSMAPPVSETRDFSGPPNPDGRKLRQDMIQMRHDFFDKTQELQNVLTGLSQEVHKAMSTRADVDVDEVVSMVLQKMPVGNGPAAQLDEDSIVSKVLKRIPKAAGAATYEVAPLEKIQKGFLDDAKNKIISDVGGLNDEQKKVLKFVETQTKGCNQTQILSKCLFISATSGGSRERVSRECREMNGLGLARMDKNSIVYPRLKERIRELIGLHNASEQEIEGAYSHILMEMLK